jgi:hypothetical protein
MPFVALRADHDGLQGVRERIRSILFLLPDRLACVPDEFRLPPVVFMRQMSLGLKLAQWSQSPRPELADG